MKGSKSGLTLCGAWAALLTKNEQTSRAGHKPMTDAQLVAVMKLDFPSKRTKTTITRVSMVRGCYNKGSNMFAAAGPAGSKGRLISYAYDEDGVQIPHRKMGGVGLSKAARKAASGKKAKVAKTKTKIKAKVVKKVAKKVVKKIVRKSAPAASVPAEPEAITPAT